MIKPIGDKLVVELDEPEETTPSGIIIPDQAKEKTTAFAKVLALGSQEEWPFKMGQRIIIDKYAGTDIKIDGKKCLVIKEINVYGVFE